MARCTLHSQRHLKKSSLYQFNMSLGGSQSRSGRCDAKENLFPLPEIEPRLLDCPAPSTFTAPPELSWLIPSYGLHEQLKILYTCFMPVPVAVLSKAWVCGRSPAEIVGSNPAAGMDVRLLWVLCVRWRFLRQANHSSRNPTDCGASLCVIKKPHERGGPDPRWAATSHERNIYVYICVYIYVYMCVCVCFVYLQSFKRIKNL
jgi:hypothetical protein